KFISALSGAVVALPHVARAQRPAMPVVAFITNGSPNDSAPVAAAFRKGLNETGYLERQNDRLPALAADMARRQVAVIATPANVPAALAAKAATATVPIVFGVSEDPV